MKLCQPSNKSFDSNELEDRQDQADWPLGVVCLVGHLERALRLQLRQILKPLGLTVGQYAALSVFCSSGHLSNAKLAKHTMVSPQAANELIKGMAKNGWILRKPDPNHGRIIQISLTKEGQRLLLRCNKAIAKVEQRMLQGLSDQEITTLHGHLRGAAGVLREL